LTVIRERIEAFFKNLATAIFHCVLEEGGLLPVSMFIFGCFSFLCAIWVIGVVVYDLVLDPHLAKASLDSVSINPEKWFPR
jgi:hypothetical protein